MMKEKKTMDRRVHQMKLNPLPFEMINKGQKTIELRLFDEKRRQIKIGDEIVFTDKQSGQTLRTIVSNLYRFADFEELYHSLPLKCCGYTEEALSRAKAEDMEAYYSLEEQQKYGVLGIEIRKVAD